MREACPGDEIGDKAVRVAVIPAAVERAAGGQPALGGIDGEERIVRIFPRRGMRDDGEVEGRHGLAVRIRRIDDVVAVRQGGKQQRPCTVLRPITTLQRLAMPVQQCVSQAIDGSCHLQDWLVALEENVAGGVRQDGGSEFGGFGSAVEMDVFHQECDLEILGVEAELDLGDF